MTQSVVIVNTGCANISSVKFALQRLHPSVVVSEDVDVIRNADKVIFPGVGSANAAMRSIEQKQLLECITTLSQPVLGVCLGMQLLVTESEEGPNGVTRCLNLIPGRVKRMQAADLRLPHMGWNTVTPVQNQHLFEGIPTGTYFYFVHSFSVAVGDYTAATCDYGAVFSASLQKDNYFGVQFHPERSGEAGAQLLENFIKL